MIRSTKHSLKFSNTGKIAVVHSFINEYRRVASIILDDIWANGYKEFNIQNKQYKLYQFLDYNDFDISTSLSGRALSSLVTQLSGVIRACTDKQKRRLLQYEKTPNNNLLKAIEKFKTTKPETNKLNPELSSKCIDFQLVNGEFYGFLRLQSIGKSFDYVNLPIKLHKVNNKYADWNLKNSFCISQEYITCRWEKEISIKSNGEVVGVDQGQTTCLTMSDGQVTKKDKHNHDLSSICDKLSRKKKNSKSFKRAQDHRTNYIGWSINQLNLSNIKELHLEKIYDMRRGKNTSRKLKHFSYPLIRERLIAKAELHGVHVVEQNSAFRSQRCSECGWVQKKNRKGREFTCHMCNHSMDADLNASINHVDFLPPVFHLVKSKLNVNGFYWIPDGIYDRFGQELRVPDSQNSNY